MANKYRKALKHLKNKTIDEKLELLSEIPTNHTGGLYTDVPGVNEPPETVPGDIDSPLNLEEDGDGAEGYTGNDTTGLFLADGTIKSVEPPGDTSYILGPMMSMWYAWANYTQIGYVRQSDRKMVNLGRITGEMSAWDGETGFTGYGQMSIEQAVWFKDQIRTDYRAFYPGPPSNPADQYGRYIGSMISTSKSTTRTVPGYWEPGTQRGFNATDDLALLLKNKEIADKNRSDEISRMALNALMLGLDIAAVVALLFPEPASSVAGAAHLATKLRYVAKLARALSRLNPFKSSPKPKITYRYKPTKAKYGDSPKSKPTPKQLKYNPKEPGGGKEYQAAARNFQRQNPGKYNPYRSDSANKLMKQQGVGTKPSQNPKFGKSTKFNNSYEYDSNNILLEQINNYLLLETATAVPSLSGGTEAADGYVDKVSETSSPEQLEKASNDANNIAKEGGRGLSDSDLAKIDKDAEAEAKRLTNFDVSNPESMNADQLQASTEMMFEVDPDWLLESFDRNEYLIDGVKHDKLLDEYRERGRYISGLEYTFSISPEFKRYYTQAEYLHKTYVSQINFGSDVNGYTEFTNKNTGERLGGNDLLYKKLMEWSDLFTKTWDTHNSKTVRDRTNKDHEENENNYKKQTDILFRPFYIQIIREWSQRGADVNDDPFSIKDYINQQFGNSMSEAEKKKLLKALMASGVDFGEIAAIPAALPLLASPAGQAALAAGAAAVGTLLIKSGIDVSNIINTGRSDAGYGAGTNRGQLGKELTPQQQAEVEAAGNELRDARRALNDLPADATDAQRDMAQERLDRANKNRTRVRNKNKTDNQNRKESYEPRFLKNRERKNLTETRTPKQKRIIRDIKKPVEVKEIPTKVKVSPKLRNNKSVGVDMMKIPEIPNQFKPPTPNIWATKDREKNIRASQEKKNEVLELVGAAEHHWTYMTEDRRKKQQEKVSEMMSAEYDKQMELLYEKHRIKEGKLNKAISAFRKPTDIKPEYPETPPPEPDPKTGMHPKYGKRYKHDKLDPHSAEFMPPTGDPVIDANIKKATNQKEKARKLKILLGKRA